MKSRPASLPLEYYVDGTHPATKENSRKWEMPVLEVSKVKGKMSRRQYAVCINIGVINIGFAFVFSMLAPLYPKEAVKKGLTATEYGFVIGVYSLTKAIVSLCLGKHIVSIGAKFMLVIGIFIMSGGTILFGLMDLVYGRGWTLGLSIAIRVFESVGAAAVMTSKVSIIASEFPGRVSSTFASLEVFFGVGLILGPIAGSELFVLGGFILPFLVLGFFLFFSAILTIVLMPSQDENAAYVQRGSFTILKVFAVSLSACYIIAASCSMGFLGAVLEPHIRQFNLSPVVIGVVLSVSNAVYALTATIWGWMCNKTGNALILCSVGATFMCACYLFLGPAPFMPFNSILWLSIIALVCNGLGGGCEWVCALNGALNGAIENGYPNDLGTHGIISSLYAASFAIGFFIGPFLGGYLYDTFGFQLASMFFMGMHVVLVIVTLLHHGWITTINGNLSYWFHGTKEERSYFSKEYKGNVQRNGNGIFHK